MLSTARSCRSSICPGRLSTAWLVSLVVFSCHNYGLQVVTRDVHRSSLRRLICPAQDHFIFLTCLITSTRVASHLARSDTPSITCIVACLLTSMTFVLSLTQMFVFLSFYVMLSISEKITTCEMMMFISELIIQPLCV